MKGHRRTSTSRVSDRKATDVITEGNRIFAIGTMPLRDLPAGCLFTVDPPAPAAPVPDGTNPPEPLTAALLVASDNSLVDPDGSPIASDGSSVASAE